MDSIDIMRACLRQWFIIVPIIALAAVGGLTYANHRPAVYTAQGTVTMYYQAGQGKNTTTDDPRVNNPLYLTGGTSLLESSLVVDLEGPGVKKQLRAKHDNATFTITPNQYNPLIVISTKGDTAEQAARTALDLISLTESEFVALQKRAGATDASLYHTFTVIPVTSVQEILPSKAKFLLAFIGAAVVLACIIAVIAERFAIRRRRAKRASSDVLTAEEFDPASRSLQRVGQQNEPPRN